jgi:hypothetical protein
LPAAIGIAFLLSQEPDFYAELTPQGLIVSSLNRTILYSEIREIWFAGANARAVYVVHGQGVLRIPNTVRFSAAEIYAFLVELLPCRLNKQVHSAISNYYQSHLQTFGEDRVWAHNARARSYATDGRRRTLVGWAIFATVVLWCIAAAALQQPGWAGVGVLMGLVTLLLYVLQGSLSKVGRGVKRWQQSSLVIGPAGLALVQGDLTGELRWREVRSIRLRDRGPAGRRRIELRVEGAQINIFDFYDSPISEIHRQIETYWQKG